MAERAAAGRRSLEVEFFRMLNRVVEPIVRRGFGSPRLAPSGFIVLETVGRKSGELRRSPLAATRIGRHMIVATFRGDRSQWVRNLAAQPRTRYWTRGAPHETRRVRGPRGRAHSRVAARAAAARGAVSRSLHASGLGIRGALPRAAARRARLLRRFSCRRELRPRRAAHGEARGDDRVLRRARLLGARPREVARRGRPVLLDPLRQPEDQRARARDVAAPRFHAARARRRSRAAAISASSGKAAPSGCARRSRPRAPRSSRGRWSCPAREARARASTCATPTRTCSSSSSTTNGAAPGGTGSPRCAGARRARSPRTSSWRRR